MGREIMTKSERKAKKEIAEFKGDLRDILEPLIKRMAELRKILK